MNRTVRAQVYRQHRREREQRARFVRGQGWTYLPPSMTVDGQWAELFGHQRVAVTPYPAPKEQP